MKVFAIAAAIGLSAIPAFGQEPMNEEAFADYIKSQNESAIVETSFQPVRLWVTMRDDGSIRDGFAQYVCIEMNMRMGDGAKNAVTIYDAYAMAQGDFVKIGEAFCS